MELRVVTKSEEELVLEIADEGHTFLNVLKRALLDTEGVAAATYDMNPAQSGGQTDPLLTIKTESGEDPLEVLEAATRSIRDRAESFRDAFADAAA